MSEKKELLRPDRQSLDELLELQAERKKTEDIAAWRLMKLHNRLLTKHHETFWIEGENEINDGKDTSVTSKWNIRKIQISDNSMFFWNRT